MKVVLKKLTVAKVCLEFRVVGKGMLANRRRRSVIKSTVVGSRAWVIVIKSDNYVTK